jgi:osmoprotectant transport system substrate-binding protein
MPGFLTKPDPAAALRRQATGLLLVLSCALVASGCGLRSSSGVILAANPGTVKHSRSLDGVQLTVASKNFTEQLILGNMLSTLLSTAGATVTNLTNTPGSFGVRRGLLNGDIDISPEYTGTGWINYLGHSNPLDNPRDQWLVVQREDKRKNGLEWLPPAPMNNTYAMAMGPAAAKKLHITKLSQLKGLPKSQRTFCLESEFATRNDGFVPMLKKYGMTKSDIGKVTTLDTGVVYTATADGACNFGEVFTTDGRIPGLGLKVLEDDKHFFPLYNLTEVIQEDVLRRYPVLKEIFAKVNPRLTNATMQKLNAKVDVAGEDPAIVARDWLIQEGLVRR